MKKDKRKNRSGLLIIAVAVMVLCGIIFIKEKELLSEKAALTVKVSELNEQIDEEKEIKKELISKKAYMQTVRYVEDIAREKLGLVFPDEIIFREKDDD